MEHGTFFFFTLFTEPKVNYLPVNIIQKILHSRRQQQQQQQQQQILVCRLISKKCLSSYHTTRLQLLNIKLQCLLSYNTNGPQYLNVSYNAYRYTTPLATKPRKTFCWPASLLTHCTFRIAWKVAFTPVVLVVYRWQFLVWHISCILLTLCYCKILAICMHIVLTNWKNKESNYKNEQGRYTLYTESTNHWCGSFWVSER